MVKKNKHNNPEEVPIIEAEDLISIGPDEIDNRVRKPGKNKFQFVIIVTVIFFMICISLVFYYVERAPRAAIINDEVSELKSIVKGTKLNERFRSSETVEKAEVDERKFNFLYIDGDNCFFMDNKTFEQVEISKQITDEKYKLLKENLEVTISFMEEKPISLELPNNIECIIETTDAAIKNQTASSSYKPALLDCGIKINVPPFIESGEKIIIDTRTLEYVKRVN